MVTPITLKYWYPLSENNVANAVKQLAAIENIELTPQNITLLLDKYIDLKLTVIDLSKNVRFVPSVKIDGVWYDFVDPTKAPIGWLADLSLVEDGKVEQLCAMLYYRRGVKYGAVDEYGNIKYPLEQRAALFYDKFPLLVYVAAVSEFMKLMENVGEYIRTVRAANGEQASWDKVFWAVAKFYRLGFFDVMDLNIRLFYHLLNVQNQIISEENERYRKLRKKVAA